MIVAVPATVATVHLARETVRSVQTVAPALDCHVIDVDDSYVPWGSERVHSASEAGALHLGSIRLTHDDADFLTALTALWAAHLLTADTPVLGLAPGIVLLRPPDAQWDDEVATIAIARSVVADPQRSVDASLLSSELFLLGTGARPHLAGVEELVGNWRTASRWLDLFVARVPHRLLADDALLVSRWNSDAETILHADADGGLTRDGRQVLALALDGFDPATGSLFDSRPGPSSGPLMSRNPQLASAMAPMADSSANPSARYDPAVRKDAAVVRACARAAVEAGADIEDVGSELDGWLLELLPVADRAPAARYLTGVRSLRTDLRDAFPYIPGSDSARLARWALDHGVQENGYDPVLLREAAERTLAAQPPPDPADETRPRGVNLVGYLAGELGVGTSARLMDVALTAAGVATSTFPVSTNLESRTSAAYRTTTDTRYDTTLLAVNADQTEAVSRTVEDVVSGSYRIGMWYWEVESFPSSRHGAFAHVDEIWTATDFVREAIAPHSPVPVRTVLPPLPQRSGVEPPPLPERLGIDGDVPWFFFAFDYLSSVERKNPRGLIEAFSRAFAPGEGPMLVIKTINATRRLADAEQLRLWAARRPDVMVIDEFLAHDELTALMGRCTAYVSLHRAEGLGLTVAEAMAWARPVVVSAYSGSMQFTSAQNALLVPCHRTAIPAGVEPYPAGTPWAQPDLDVAAAHMRDIVADPEAAAAIGRRAADDIATLHSPVAAAGRVRQALGEAWSRRDELEAERVARERRSPLDRLRRRRSAG